ncbi:Golgi transport complex subunit 6 [Malassezia psittaci]|uniref:Conserved oligomeric Golgi complex subunit 6 n=1 Tax=Malassezia psittaci TaxID=1821823 RepID=A0AAF0F641_9BASI|nr:Golgi transport complex subunit 6 [Malassezia psittaci]
MSSDIGTEMDTAKRSLNTTTRAGDAVANTDAVSILNELYPTANLTTIQKHAKRDLRRETKRATRDFCTALRNISDVLGTVQEEIAHSLQICTSTKASLESARLQAQPVLEQALALKEQMKTADMHERLAKNLVSRLTLSDEEQAIILDDETPIDHQFFAVIDRLHSILQDSQTVDRVQTIVSSPSTDAITNTPNHAASSILTKTPERLGAMDDVRQRNTAFLDTAYRRVAKYASSNLRRLPIEGAEGSDTLRDALGRLAHREDLFRSVLFSFAESRNIQIPGAFEKAMTVGQSATGHSARPIELHAHDASRYVSDMLAWVHQLLANERDLIASLLCRLTPRDEPLSNASSTPQRRRRIGERHPGIDTSVDWSDTGPLLRPGCTTLEGPVFDSLIRKILDSNIVGCCHPLKTRVLQTLHSLSDSFVILQLISLLCFYRSTMQNTMGSRTKLNDTLQQLVDAAELAFTRSLQAYASSQLASLSSLPEHSALAVVQDAANHIQALLKDCQLTVQANQSSSEDLRRLQTSVISHCIKPLQTHVLQYANQLKNSNPDTTDGWSRYLRWSSTSNQSQQPKDTRQWQSSLFTAQALVPVWVCFYLLIQHALEPYLCDLDLNQVPIQSHLVKVLENLIDTHVCCALIKLSTLLHEASLPSLTDAGNLTTAPTQEALQGFLASSEVLIPSSHLHSLSLPLRNAVHKAALTRFVHQYTEAQPTSSSLPTPTEVAMILDIPLHNQVYTTAELAKQILVDLSSTKST